jgi:hypothetical protein
MVAAFDKICTERLSLGETTVDDIWYGTEKTQNPNGTDDVYAKLELWKDQLQGAYENLFRIFYHRSCSQTITTIDDTRRVLELADKYCCLSTVSAVLTERVLSAPTEHSGLFSLQPVMMLNVSIKLRSKILFHDAFVHLVGRWKSLRHNSVAELPEGVRKLVEQEYMRICEDQLHTIHSVIGSYSNNATLTLIRSCINDNKPSKMYRGLSNITNCTIPVNGLTKNNLRLGGTAEFDHLTCACLRDNDYPWEGGDWW